ncbi:MAG: zf-HC2 domain-containing protein, partial [Okeania sp. SIO3B3]|nr:zf-HC2 domain-containing protein [Okeania sp. SIO3B3]
MRQEQVYEMISGLVDNELSPDKRYQVLKHLEQDDQSQDDYHQLQALKTNLSSTLPQDKPSDNFETLLKQRIENECSQKPSWFEQFSNNWEFNWGNK